MSAHRNEKERALVALASWAAIAAQIVSQAIPVLSFAATPRPDDLNRSFIIMLAVFFVPVCGGLFSSYQALKFANSEDEQGRRAYRLFIDSAIFGLGLAFVFFLFLLVAWLVIGGAHSP